MIVVMACFSLHCYSFTGANIPPGINTVGIPVAEDISGFGQSEVRQNLTNILIQKFTQEGSLRVANRSVSDAVLEPTIESITDDAVGVSTGETTTTKRITLRVSVTYRDQKKQKTFWTREFSQTADYPISLNLAGVRTALNQAEDKVSEDILLAVISNW